MRDTAFIVEKLLEKYPDLEVSSQYPFFLLIKEWGRKVKCWEGKRSGLFEYAIEEGREYSILLGCGQINLF